MTTTMTQVRRAGLGLIVAAFSIGVVATSTGGTVLAGAPSAGHAVSANHVWGN
jgi:hypothetical protein